MKRSKRFLSLFLALAFAFSLMASTALAAVKDDTAQPQYQVVYCPRCNGSAQIESIARNQVVYMLKPVGTCSNNCTEHYHSYIADVTTYACSSCGVFQYTSRLRNEQCPYA